MQQDWKKPKKSLSWDGAENLAESNKGLLPPPGAMVEGVERAAKHRMSPVSFHMNTNNLLKKTLKHMNRDLSLLSRNHWSCGKFMYWVPLRCSSDRMKPVRRTKLILHFRQWKKCRAFAINRALFLAFELSVAIARQPQRFLVFSICIRGTRVLN